ncbi:MAG: glycoside hydrolase family 16 protein [Rhodothermales bacterium]|nr:glycoside hydrolase family 16 protein [Rhodothermales bacterium]
MRRLFPALFLILLAPSLTACDSTSNEPEPEPEVIPAKEGYSLVWNDEFEGHEVNTANWTHWVTGNPFNNELQYYTARKDNSTIEDGVLYLVARKETYTAADGTREYTSARINTKDKVDFKYGRVEVRAQMPIGQGIWPAIWMLPTDNVYGGWPHSGEIDIMEYLGHEPRTVYGTLHYTRENAPQHYHEGSSYTLPSGAFSDDFHVFELEWDETEMRWYVDGVQYRVHRNWSTFGHDYPAPFDQRFHLLLNVAVGGDWPGSPSAATAFPQIMKVDYVRVFERVAAQD